MTELVLGIRLTADGKDLVGAVKQSEAAIGKMGDATKQAASEAERLNAQQNGLAKQINVNTQAQLNANYHSWKAAEAWRAQHQAVAGASNEIQKILNRYDPLGTKLRQLQSDFAALDKAIAAGATGGTSDLALDKTMRAMNEEIGKTKGLMQAAGVATDGAGVSMTGLGLNSQYARRELMMLGREAMTGDFSQMPRTFGSLVAHSNLLSVALHPVTLAVVALGAGAALVGVLAAHAEQTARALNRLQTEFTASGREGLFPTSQLKGFIDELARMPGQTRESATATISALASVPNVSAPLFERLVSMVGDFAAATGQKAPDAMKKLASAFTDPVGQARKLHDDLGILTGVQILHIESLYNQGEALKATEIVLDAVTERTKGLAIDGLTPLQKATNELGNEWDRMKKGFEGTPNSGVIKYFTDLTAKLTAFVSAVNNGDTANAILKMAQLGVGNALTGGLLNSIPDFPTPTPGARSAAGSIRGLPQQRTAQDIQREIDAAVLAAGKYAGQSKTLSDLQNALIKNDAALKYAAAGSKEALVLAQAHLDIEKKIAETKSRMAGVDKNLSAYNALIKSIEEKTALDALELRGVQKLGDAEKLAVKTMVELRDGTLKLTDPQKLNLAGKLEEFIITDKLNTQAKTTFEARAKAEKEYEDLQTKNEAFLETLERKKTDALITAEKGIKQLQFETELIGLSAAGRKRAIALRALETSGIDKESAAYAGLEQRLRVATDARDKALEVQALKEKSLKEFNELWSTVERTGKDVFVHLFADGKNAFEGIGKAIKASVIDLLYQLTARKWMIQIGAGISGSLGMTAANAAGTHASELFLGSTVGDVAGSLLGNSGLASIFGAGVGGLGGALGSGIMTAAPVYEAGALVSAGTSASLFSGPGLSAAMGAIPGWGWAALGAAAIATYMSSGNDEPPPGYRHENWAALRRNNGVFGVGSSEVPDPAAMTALAQALNAALNDPAKYDRATLDKLVGVSVTGAPGTSSQALIDALLQKLEPAAAAAAKTVEDLAKAEVLGSQRRQMEIALMEAQGDAAGALAAKREDELKALDPTLRALQQQIYAAQDLAAAANVATAAVKNLADAQGAASTAVDAQISASQTAAQTAHDAARSYRDLTASLADAVVQLRGGELSPLLPAQKLAEARAQLNAVYGQAATGDAAALGKLPQTATAFLEASRSYNASSAAYTADFNTVMTLLNQAGVASQAMTNWEEYQATLLDTQTGVLTQIRDQLALESPDAAVLRQQVSLLETIGGLLTTQTQQIIATGAGQMVVTHTETGRILSAKLAVTDLATGALVGLTTSQTQQIVTGNAAQDVIKNIEQANKSYPRDMLSELVTGSTLQSSSLQSLVTGNANVVSLLSQMLTYQDQAALEKYNAGKTAAYQQIYDFYNKPENKLSQDATRTAWDDEGTKYLEHYVKQVFNLAGFDAAVASWTAAHPIPGHASGLNYVPYDNYTANLHVGEAVLTAPQATEWRGSGGASNADLIAAVKEAGALIARASAQATLDSERQTAALKIGLKESSRDIGNAVSGELEARSLM